MNQEAESSEAENSDESSEAECFSTDAESDGDSGVLAPPQCQDEYSAQVRSWTERIPIGLGLCPWAIKSNKQGRSKYITCEGNTPSDVTKLILLEAKALCRCSPGSDDKLLSLRSALVVCPNVGAWNQDFTAFDGFVRSFGTNAVLLSHSSSKEEDAGSCLDLLQQVTLVSFHPQFLRWRGLPSNIKVGSNVQCHKGMGGFQKSQHPFPATVMETSSSMFGLRRIKVRFNHDGKEQYVPIDWLVASQKCDQESSGFIGPPLPDNVMHQAPYPTIHLIRNEDLATLCIRDISRVKRKNAQRMKTLGWDGVC